jgi:lipopolysaccharide export system permease protein
MMQFDAHSVRVIAPRLMERLDNDEAMHSFALWGMDDHRYEAELHSRLAKPLMILPLAAIALALSYTDPRRGRFYNLFLSILVFFMYSNLLGIGKTLVWEGRLPAYASFWTVHLLFISLAAWFLWRRHQGLPLIGR